MSFISFVLKLVEFVWCFVMPVLGSLHLISSKYRQENTNKADLLRHWCLYWMAFVILNLFSMYLPLVPSALINILRLAVLSVLATPKLQITLSLLDYIQGKADIIIGVKNKAAEFVAEKLGAKVKTS